MITERTVVLMPVRDRISEPTRRCLERLTDGEVEVLVEVGKPVDRARNDLLKRALALPDRPRYVIWADADAVWTGGTFERLRSDIRKLGERALVGVLHGPRSVGAEAHVMREIRPPVGVPIRWGIDYPKAQTDPSALLQVVFCGGHMLAHDIRLLDALPANPWSPRDGEFSEDFAFNFRVHEAKGGSVWCDTACPVLHFDEETGYAFLPGYFPPFAFDSDGLHHEVPDDGTGWANLREVRRRSYGALVDSRMTGNKVRAMAMVR